MGHLEDPVPQPQPPFSGCLLRYDPHDDSASPSLSSLAAQRRDTKNDHRHKHSLLPASFLTETDDLASPGPDDSDATIDDSLYGDLDSDLDRELDLARLTKVHRYLWLVGRPNPPRPLHRQLAIGREIIIDERLDMHLVWHTGRIFVKPLPRFLLCPAFWSRYLTGSSHPGTRCSCNDPSAEADASEPEKPICKRLAIRKRALGLLVSYIALIRYESDFYIAQERHLLPKELTWPAWGVMTRQVIHIKNIYSHIDQRFVYGELRLSRLNKIYRLLPPLFFTGYIRAWQRYDEFWNQTFAVLASVIVYIAIVLGAMQVGLATIDLADNRAFHSAAYVFTIFSILGPLIFSGMALVFFCFLFVNNWNSTKAYKAKRMRYIEQKAQV
ncbi:hypothetical protein AK830_g9110 [Neonectria ditissima]|uniref:Uncharacterized protein n=1 Tax=Neonectria ditissima TaxID=78410 RepID=A0A0P7B6D0_9HYPO|nr:hypothetical protein AK830_g9110 [Neonectria ditissima]